MSPPSLLLAFRFARRASRLPVRIGQVNFACCFCSSTKIRKIPSQVDLGLDAGVDGSWFNIGRSDNSQHGHSPWRSHQQPAEKSTGTERGKATKVDGSTPAWLKIFAARHGRIRLDDLMRVLHKAESTTPYPLSMEDEIFLLRSCGNLLAMESADTRQLALQRVLELIKSVGQMTVEHHNALLATQLTNGHLFSPVDVISAIKAEGQSPNDQTYQLLIERYCEVGELEAASVVMTRMQQVGMAVNDRVFNSLIFCNLRMRDLSGAASMMEMSVKRGLPLTSQTYATIVRGYAANGDVARLKQSLVDANKNGIRLSDEDILEAVVAAAKSDNSAAIPEILQLLPREFGFGLKCVNVSFRLASLGKFNDALEVASVVPSDTKTAEDREEVGMFFLNFIMERMKSETIVEVAKEMENRRMITNAMLEAVRFLLKKGRIDEAKSVLLACEEAGKPMRPQMFWPFLKSALHARNLEDFMMGLTWMARCCHGETLTLDSAALIVMEDMVKNFGSDWNLISRECEKKRLKKLNYRFWINSHLIWCLRSYRLQPFITSLEKQAEYTSVGDLLPKITDQFVALMELETVEQSFVSAAMDNLVAVMKALHGIAFRKRSGSSGDSNGLILWNICSRLKDESELIINFAQNMLKNDLYISEQNRLRITDLWCDTSRPTELPKILNDLAKFVPLESSTSFDGKKPAFINEELVRHFHEYCQNGKVSEAESLYTQLKNSGSIPNYFVTLMCNMYVKLGDADLALQKLQESPIPPVASIKLAALLFQKQRREEALEVLGRAHKSDTLEYFNAKPLVNLLELVVSLDDGDQLFYKILEIFKAKGYQVGGRCQGVLIHEYLAKGRLADAKTAVERILKETENQRILPPIYRDLIRTGDSAKIQHLFELESELCGSERAVFDLGSAFCEMEEPIKAQQLFEKSKVRLSRDELKQKLEFYATAKNVKALEGLVRATVHVNFDRNSAYQYLFETYAKINDWKSAHNTLVNLKETEDLELDSTNLTILTRLFRSNKQPLPFKLNSTKKEVDTIVELKSLLASGECAEAMGLVKRAGVGQFNSRLRVVVDFISQELLPKDRCNEAMSLVELFIRNDIHFPFGCLFSLCDKLTQSSNLAALEKLTTLLSPADGKRCFLHSRIWGVKVQSLSGDELLAHLRSSWEKELPVESFRLMLEKQPGLLEPLIQLAHSQMRDGFNQNLLRIWEYLMLHNRERADKMLQNELRLEDIPDFILCRTAKELKDESLLRGYQEQNLFTKHPEMPYSYLIGIQLEKKDLDGAIKVVEEAERKGIPKLSLNPKVLYFLQRRLKDAKKPFSFLKTNYPSAEPDLKSYFSGTDLSTAAGSSSSL